MNSKKELYSKFLSTQKTQGINESHSKRKINESYTSIEMDDGDYYECLAALFVYKGERENNDCVEWYTNIGMDLGIAPNKMYDYVRYEATLSTTEEILNDVFDKSLDEDFSDEGEAIRFIFDNFDGALNHKKINGENLFLYVP